MRVLVAMSGGVDSSVAAALLRDDGVAVVGCTLRLWGGESDSGCCSAADVDDARRVCQVLGIDHHVFNLDDDFAEGVVAPYVAAHGRGATPNPCVACNRTIKFGVLASALRGSASTRSRRATTHGCASGHRAPSCAVVPTSRRTRATCSGSSPPTSSSASACRSAT